jgi:hypothetical protein
MMHLKTQLRNYQVFALCRNAKIRRKGVGGAQATVALCELRQYNTNGGGAYVLPHRCVYVFTLVAFFVFVFFFFVMASAAQSFLPQVNWI